VTYELTQIFGWVFFLLCSTLGFLGIVDIVIRHGFIPVCKSIWRNILRAVNDKPKSKRAARQAERKAMPSLDAVSES
jgi:hypothetical protein